jgi:hypothetical protein
MLSAGLNTTAGARTPRGGRSNNFGKNALTVRPSELLLVVDDYSNATRIEYLALPDALPRTLRRRRASLGPRGA